MNETRNEAGSVTERLPPAVDRARAALDFCAWLKGYLSGCAGRDELTAFEGNTIRNTLNEMVYPRPAPTPFEGKEG